MARRRPPEEHQNHEAWAIPYGDLITLLLAFFVVMYAMSSVNEGKYRVLSNALNSAFRGAPESPSPIQLGRPQSGATPGPAFSVVPQGMIEQRPAALPDAGHSAQSQAQLRQVSGAIETAMSDLIRRGLVGVTSDGTTVHVDIRTDLLFPSGSATLTSEAVRVIDSLGQVLGEFPNDIDVEGHTDNVPISTAAFPSNWELSAARAASVVHLLTNSGVDAARLTVTGRGEFRPIQSNDTVEGRMANRRVVVVVSSAADAALPQAFSAAN